MSPRAWLYRHEEVITPRPYGVDVDENDWLWEGCGPGNLSAHHLGSGDCQHFCVDAMEGHSVYQVFALDGRLLLTLGDCPFYIVLDPKDPTRAERRPLPGARPIVWYGCKTPQGRVILYERKESLALVLDSHDAEPRIIPCPFPGQLAGGQCQSDGLVYSTLCDPARVVRFDPVSERFVDEVACPFPDATFSGRHEHNGIIYFCDSARGRIVPYDMESRSWLEPIRTPDHGKVYGFMGVTFSYRGWRSLRSARTSTLAGWTRERGVSLFQKARSQ